MSWRTDGRPEGEDELDQVLCDLTELGAALAEEHAEMVRLLSATVESQLSVLDVLDALAARSSAPDVEASGMLGLTEPADNNEALRMEARQTVRHSGEIIAQSQSLITRRRRLSATRRPDSAQSFASRPVYCARLPLTVPCGPPDRAPARRRRSTAGLGFVFERCSVAVLVLVAAFELRGSAEGVRGGPHPGRRIPVHVGQRRALACLLRACRLCSAMGLSGEPIRTLGGALGTTGAFLVMWHSVRIPASRALTSGRCARRTSPPARLALRQRSTRQIL